MNPQHSSCVLNASCDLNNTTVKQPVMDHSQCQVLQKVVESDVDVDCPWDECDSGTHETISIDKNDSLSHESTQLQSCGVCFEVFQVNQLVSWSSTSDCEHVFHPQCIQKWLLRHEHCPICRRPYLIVDYTRQAIPTRQLKALRKKYKARRRYTYFCVQDGLMMKDISDAHESSERKVVKTVNVENCVASCHGLPEVVSEQMRLEHREDGDVTVIMESDEEGLVVLDKEKLTLPFRQASLSTKDSALTCLNLPISHETSTTDWNADVDRSQVDSVILTKESTETVSTAASSVVSKDDERMPSR